VAHGPRSDSETARSLRDGAVALLASRALVWACGISAFLVAGVGADARYDHGGLTKSFGAVGNALAAPAVRWDSNWYVDIAHHGYANGAVEPAFFPLYPLLMRAVGVVTGSVVLAGVLISFAAFAVALTLLHRLTALELGADAARRTVVLLAFFPTALFFSAVYTEALFLALELGAFYAARRGRWAWAGALGALGAATRNTGSLLAVALLFLYLYGPREDREPLPRRAGLRPRYALGPDIAWIGLVPLGLAAYLAYLGVHLHDALATFHATHDYFHRSFDGPLSGLWEGAAKAYHATGALLAGNGDAASLRKIALFVVAMGVVSAAVGVIRRLPSVYGVYTVVSLLPVLSFPYPPGPLASSLRYVAVVFPLFMWLGLRLSDRRAYALTVAVFTIGLAYSAGMFATWHFVA